MENLHTPTTTIPSVPTSIVGHTNGIHGAGLSLSQLQGKKDSIEAELRALGSVLDSHRVDMSTTLLTPDGFPRADLDVAQIRTTRARILYLRNDLKYLMNDIEKHIHEHFAKLSEGGPSEVSMTNGSLPSNSAASIPPFAKVNGVVESSPAASAGVQTGDLIRSFGPVNNSNHDGLKRVAECVQQNEGRDIVVKISRPIAGEQAQEIALTITPRQNWGGRGLLGCHILPL